MMREAIDVIRTLWKGEVTDYYGTYYLVEKARLFSLPKTLPPIIVSGMGPIAAKVAAESGDQLVHVLSEPQAAMAAMAAFRAAGGLGKPCMAEISFCYHEDEAKAKEIAYRWWPIAANAGELNWLLPGWGHYEQLQRMVTPDKVAEKIVCGPDLERFVAKVREVQGLGFDRISIHQAGPDQDTFFRFAREELLPALR
jgi:G6PDH family F420-dependent oxidoreductase